MTEDASSPHCEIRHASCVANDAGAVLILGASGRGKSALALQLIALGARLVADDRTRLTVSDGEVVADCPEAIRGMIEARFVGVLAAETIDRAAVRLVVDLDTLERDRLPPMRTYALLGQEIPLLYRVDAAHFPAAILHLLTHGRKA